MAENTPAKPAISIDLVFNATEFFMNKDRLHRTSDWSRCTSRTAATSIVSKARVSVEPHLCGDD